MKIIVINGPNLNLINKRNPEYYGNASLDEIGLLLSKQFPEIDIKFFQSNNESELVSTIHHAAELFDGIIINPGAYSHSSIAIRDALELCQIPKIEVHLSNISARENFRKISLTSSVCNGFISGFRVSGYKVAVELLKEIIEDKYETL